MRLNSRDDEPLCGAFESDPGDRVCSLSRGQTQMHLVRCGILPVFGALESDPRFSPRGQIQMQPTPFNHRNDHLHLSPTPSFADHAHLSLTPVRPFGTQAACQCL